MRQVLAFLLGFLLLPIFPQLGPPYPTAFTAAQSSPITNFGTALTGSTTQGVIPAPSPGGLIVIQVVVNTSTAGVGCGAGSNTAQPTFSITGPGGGAQTLTGPTLTASANGTLDSQAQSSLPIVVKANTGITYTVASTLASAGCTTTPQYQVFLKLIA